MNIHKNSISEINRKAEEYLKDQTELLLEYASFDSETHFIEGNKKAAALTKSRLKPLNASVKEIFFEDVGTHVFARINPGNSNGRIILNAHLDTVFPVGYAAKHPPRIEGDRLFGLGVLDCKGGIAVSIYALRILYDLGLLPDIEIDLLYTCDEEQGSETGRKLYEKYVPGADAAFIFESGYSDNDVIKVLTSRQGVILGNLDITGFEAHAGCDYSKGRSANKELANKILELYGLNDYEKGIFYNAAPVSGGRPNGVVSGEANMQFCAAGIPDMAAYKECEGKLDLLGSRPFDPDCRLDLTYKMLFPPQERHPDTGRYISLLEKAAAFSGVSIMEDGVNKNGEDVYAATDANYFAAHGIPALDGFGPEGEGMHRTDEYIYISSLLKKTRLFATFLYLM